MSPAITIYSQTYTHKGHAFQVWSYLDGPDPKRSTLHFALRVEGETVEGLADRAEAVRKARKRIDQRPPEPGEATPAAAPPQQSELAQRLAEAPARPAQLGLF
jgi:hypothetical protein